MDKDAIIKLKLEGHSTRAVSRMLSINRKRVTKYWNEYKDLNERLVTASKEELRELQEKIISAPKYDSSNRTKRKYTPQIDKLIDGILENEEIKCRELGWSKQKLTAQQIYELVISEGYDIGLTTITNAIKVKREKARECFIRQLYDFGDRLEYDFGEVRLKIDAEVGKYYLAILSSPKSNFRWAYLYKTQTKDVFLDSQVRFFDMIGVFKEVVYDNMRNVVTKFIGKNQKELNEDLVKLSIYYGFKINTTNCFKGNEKGHVEGSVKYIRNKVFAFKTEFASLNDAQVYLQSKLQVINKESSIDEEIKYLKTGKPKLCIAKQTVNKVSKYSFITIENNYYSVPEYLAGHTVNTKIYYDYINIFSNNKLVCKHKKIDGFNLYSIDIMHYLNTLLRKPGAIKNSHALKSSGKLKAIYNKYYTLKPKQFVEFLQNNKNLSIDEIVNELEEVNRSHIDKKLEHIVPVEDDLVMITRNQTSYTTDALMNN